MTADLDALISRVEEGADTYWDRPIADRLRERAAAARAEGTGTAISDATHFEQAAQALTAAEAEIARLTRERDECSPYLKDGETPAERIKRLHGEISGMMKTLAVYTDRALAAEARALTAEVALTETRAMLAEAVEALNYCEQYGSAAVKLLARSTLTKLQEAGHDAG